MKSLSENRKAYFKYEVLEKFEAGVSLIGQEVKSIKLGKINLAGSFVIFKNNEAFLTGCHVPPYQPKNAPDDYDPQRLRKLLLRKPEIEYLIGKINQKGLTLVPLKVYTKRGKVKIEIGLTKGRKKFDEREKIKKRDFNREKQRIAKENM